MGILTKTPRHPAWVLPDLRSQMLIIGILLLIIAAFLVGYVWTVDKKKI